MSAAAVSRQPPFHSSWADEQSRQGRGSAEEYYSRSSQLPSERSDWLYNRLPSSQSIETMTGTALDYAGHHSGSTRDSQLAQNTALVAPLAKTRPHDQGSDGGYKRISISNGRDGLTVEVADLGGASVSSKPRVDSIATHLQIPKSVNTSKGSLAEFAAEITCLFWFEDEATLRLAEEVQSPNPSYNVRSLMADSIPTTGFRKWVTTILSTTQVGKNVILLALLFIYRLKKFNPGVSGKRGSEYRLLTIALMLGNKFLDDNTYTNKTWAEVSGIHVTEIHIMEVEFLSNMRYELYVSESQWSDWKEKLGKFGAYYERALQLLQAEDLRSSMPVTPTYPSLSQKLPSPPFTNHNSSPLHTRHTSYPNPTPIQSAGPYLPRSPIRHYRNPVLEQLERKRSIDHSADLPPAKRMQHASQSMQFPSTIPTPTSSTLSSGSFPLLTPESSASGPFSMGDSQIGNHFVPRLPIPKIQTNMASTNQLAPISIPTTRAMSTVYASSATNTWPQPLTPISSVPPLSTGLYNNSIPSLDGSRADQSTYSSNHASPSYHVTTPSRQGLSPSYFLTHRSSPYRPVRAVNTLLIPPPSASMANAAREIPFEQIHYQPLSKGASDLRLGPLPYFHHDGMQQSNVSTPIALQQYAYRV